MKLAFVHFLPLEKYPPATNCLKELSNRSDISTIVLTTHYKESRYRFQQAGIKIYRPALLNTKQSPLLRYINYLKFNIIGFLILVIQRPSVIIYYDVLSVLPVFWYQKIFNSTQIFIHYHEYVSPDEFRKSSPYIKFLHQKEKELYLKAKWISQTNKERLELFNKDYPDIEFKNLQILPNYPPGSWLKSDKNVEQYSRIFKFVYVGALSLDTMFLKEISEWIVNLKGGATLDIYSSNYQNDVLSYFKKLNCESIIFKGEINYYDLPTVLNRYNIGLILYNGHIPNYVYNAPNKLFEYLSCGLDVWFPTTLIGSYEYITNTTYPKVSVIDFEKLNEINIDDIFCREKLKYQPSTFTSEKVLKTLIENLIATPNRK